VWLELCTSLHVSSLAMTVRARIGCSGWQYKHWRGDFYPADLPQRSWLEHYATTFDTVELNNSFYRLPSADAFRAWRARTPVEFEFAVKASRFLTHMKKLNDPEEPLERLFTPARELGGKLGPVLYQLPPRWPFNRERLADFVTALPRRARHAIEFREPSWYNDEAFALMSRHGVALCLHDMHGSASPRVVVGPFVYIRFHGTERYSGAYSDAHLHDWAQWIAARLDEGMRVFAYFNNDTGGHAPRDAVRLRTMVSGPR
jgi:uncharacterized protein YecE (DUF72 family)